MKIAGIIAEYNPFHNGHALHVEKTRAATKADYVVAVMSGAFTQRGEVALVDKWRRARMALGSGVDMVVELPAMYAVRPAQIFARGGVSLMQALGVHVISFGAETGDMAQLTQMARLMADEPPALRARIRARLDAGQSHARARGEAVAEMLSIAPEQVNRPNTALALEYLVANERLDRPMEAVAIAREGDYHDLALGEIASASAIRGAAKARGVQAVEGSMPPHAHALLAEAPALAAQERLDALLLDRLRTMERAQIAALPDVNEGLEMRIARYAREAASREELMALVKCKRYTMARISRVLTYALLGLTADLAAPYERGAPYARVLGFRQSARPLIRHMQQVAALPIVTDPVPLKGDACFGLEQRATDLWGLATDHAPYRRAGCDLTECIALVP